MLETSGMNYFALPLLDNYCHFHVIIDFCRAKLQKHLTFDAELEANEGRIKSMVEIGNQLIASKHYAADRITLQIAEVKRGWDELRR